MVEASICSCTCTSLRQEDYPFYSSKPSQWPRFLFPTLSFELKDIIFFLALSWPLGFFFYSTDPTSVSPPASLIDRLTLLRFTTFTHPPFIIIPPPPHPLWLSMSRRGKASFRLNLVKLQSRIPRTTSATTTAKESFQN